MAGRANLHEPRSAADHSASQEVYHLSYRGDTTTTKLLSVSRNGTTIARSHGAVSLNDLANRHDMSA